MWWSFVSCSWFATTEAQESSNSHPLSFEENNPTERKNMMKTSCDNLEQNGLKRDVCTKAINAFYVALDKGETKSPVYTVIDMTMHSKEKRLWTFNLSTGELLFTLRTAHGRNSDVNHDGLLDTVSNVPSSKQSSVGLYKTAEEYIGTHGRSLKLDGLEKGFNDNARERAIVIHGASYVTDPYIEQHGKSGRSWGCPAVSTEYSDRLLNVIGDGRLVFVYYPDAGWLSESSYL